MASRPGAPSELAAWLALALGFSPVLADLLRNLLENPHDHCTLLAPALLVLAVRADRSRSAPRKAPGAVLLAGGAVFELLGIGLDVWSLARLGLPLAVLGLASWIGRPALRTAALTLWLVPLPDFVATYPSPGLESRLAALGAGAARLLAPDAVAVGPLIRVPSGVLELHPTDWGYAPAFALAALGWFAALRLGRPATTGLAWVAAGAGLGCALQLPTVAAIALAAALGVPGEPAGIALREVGWIAASVLGVVAVERRARRERQEARAHVQSAA